MLKVLKLRPARGGALEPSPGMDDDLGGVLRRSREGEAGALRTLLTAVGPPMLQVIRRVLGAGHPDVEDTLQEATLALVQALPAFRAECSARHFACRIAAFTAISARRRRAPTAEAALRVDVDGDGAEGDGPLLAGDDARQADWGLAARRRELVRHLLDELPEPQAEALVLHSIVGLTVEELASATGAPMETVRSRLRLARAALRGRIAGDPAAAELTEDLP